MANELNLLLKATADKASAKTAVKDIQQEMKQVAYGGGAGLASKASDLAEKASKPDWKRVARETLDEERGRKQAKAEEAWEKEQERARAAALRKQSAPTIEERVRQSMRDKAHRQDIIDRLTPPKLPPPPGGIGGDIAGGAGKGILSSLGLGGFTLGPFAASATAATMAVIAMKKAIDAVTDAYRRGQQLYAKTLTSGGMSTGWVSQTANLSKVLGVGADDVWKYGVAIGKLSDKLKFATQVSASTANNLASAQWEIEIAKLNFQSLANVIANDAAPAIRKLADGLGQIAKFSTAAYKEVTTIKPEDNGLMKSAKAWLKIVGAVAWDRMTLGIGGLGKDTGAAPAAPADPKRQVMSSFERMGLIIGAGTGQNYAQKTAENTFKMATLLERLAGKDAKGAADLIFSNAQSVP